MLLPGQQTETNNSHFEIQASSDGETFATIKTIKSKADNGNSHIPINYEVTFGKEGLGFVLSISFFGILSVLGFAFRKKWAAWPLAALALFAIAYSCTKKDSPVDPENSNIFIRIAQVDKDGTTQYSSVVKMINE